MATITQGTVSITIPDHIPIPENAGQLKPEEVARLEKARRGIGLACDKTAEAMKKYPERLKVADVTADELLADGTAAEDIDSVIADMEALLAKIKQANRILDAAAHKKLRKVLAFVRGQEKFDPSIVDIVPVLIAYFANTPAKKDDPEDK